MDLNSLVGRELAGFQLTARVGEGGMAMVFRGENTLDPSIVRAMKVVFPHLSAQPEFVKRITLEARVLDQLQHPNVVRFYGLRSVPVGDTSLLAMELELLDGQPLSAMLRPGLPIAQAVDWVRQAAEGVSAAHVLGVVHRDLKPDNLLLTRSGQVKVLDFGIARAMDDARRHAQFTMAGVIPGTPGYLAPEVCNGALPTPAADVYALGVVLYELLLGRHPLNEPGKAPLSGLQMMFAHVQRELPRLRALRADVSETVEQILIQATAKDPAQRFADATELAAALRMGLPTSADLNSVLPASDRFSSPPPVVTNFQLSPVGVAGVGSSPSQPPVLALHGATNRVEPKSSKKVFGFVLLGGIVIAAAGVMYVVRGQTEPVRQPAMPPPARPEVVTPPPTPPPPRPPPGVPGGDFIVSQMQMRQAQYAVGMTPVLPIARGSLTTSGTQNYAISMVPGRCYKIIGIGAPSVTDLDLKLYAPTNPNGRPSALVDQDVAEDNFPVIGLARERPLCPTVAGVYRLEVTMYSGAGEFGVQVFGNFTVVPGSFSPPPGWPLL